MIIFTLNLTIENEILEENTQTCSSKMSRSKSSDIQSLLIQYPFGYFATSVQFLVRDFWVGFGYGFNTYKCMTILHHLTHTKTTLSLKITIRPQFQPYNEVKYKNKCNNKSTVDIRVNCSH